MASQILKENFAKVLHARNRVLFFKWSYKGELTNCDKDELAMCSRIAREISGTNK